MSYTTLDRLADLLVILPLALMGGRWLRAVRAQIVQEGARSND